MAFDIGKHLGQLREFCEQYGVVRLDLFGSAARDDFNEEHSDLDFLVTFEEPPKMGYADSTSDCLKSCKSYLIAK